MVQQFEDRKIMTATEFLNNARDLNLHIESTQETLERLTPPRSQLSGIATSGKTSVHENKEPERQLRRHELAEKLEKYIDELFDYKEALVRLLTSSDLTPKEKTLVEQRYMLMKTWKEIAAFMDYTETHVKRIDAEIREKLESKTYYWSFIRG